MTRCLQVPPQEAKRRKTVVMVGGMVVRRYDDTFIGGTYVTYRVYYRTSMLALASPLSRSHLLML